MDYSNFRNSSNIEDRRQDEPVDLNEWPRKGLFLPNVFEQAGMTGLNPATDFAPQSGQPNPLSIGLGINNLNPAPNSGGPASGLPYSPQGVMGAVPQSLPQQYIDAIKGFEGYSPSAQWDYKQSSSGYGTKAQPGDENIPAGQRQQVYEQRFQDEVGKAAAHVDSVNPNLPPGARAALIDLTYNAGPGWAKSGLGDLVRSGDLEGAKARLQEYNKAGGQVLPGLVNRRATTASWFDQPAPQQATQQLAQASPARAPGAPLSLAPQAPPIFAPPPQAQPQQQAQDQGSYWSQMPAEQGQAPPPIFAPQRRPVSLAQLKATFPMRPFSFSRS